MKSESWAQCRSHTRHLRHDVRASHGLGRGGAERLALSSRRNIPRLSCLSTLQLLTVLRCSVPSCCEGIPCFDTYTRTAPRSFPSFVCNTVFVTPMQKMCIPAQHTTAAPQVASVRCSRLTLDCDHERMREACVRERRRRGAVDRRAQEVETAGRCMRPRPSGRPIQFRQDYQPQACHTRTMRESTNSIPESQNAPPLFMVASASQQL